VARNIPFAADEERIERVGPVAQEFVNVMWRGEKPKRGVAECGR
jgi:hypothetical protein